MENKIYPWDGPKTDRLEIRVTPTEKKELEELCRMCGGIGLGRYLVNLHHRAMGRFGTEEEK